MRYITGLDLNNVVCFKKLSVDFDKNLTYVRGLNLDSDPADPTSNGAGKTLMFSALANVRYQTTPLALKKKSKKDLLRNKGSSIGFIMRQSKDGPEYEIIQTSNGYKIYEDGRDLELRTIPLAEEFIRKLWPMTETQFYSTCYLSTERPYPLQRDTDSNRLQHITDIFNLDQYSGIRDILSQRLRSIKDNEIKLSVLEQHLVGIRKKIGELKSPVSSDKYNHAKATYKRCAADIDRVQAQRFSLTTQQRDIESLLEVERKLDALRKQYTFKAKPNAFIETLKEQRSVSRSWDRWAERTDQVKEQIAKITAKIEAIELPEQSEEELTESRNVALTKIERLNKSIASYTDVKNQHDRVSSEIDEIEEQLSATGIDTDKLDFDRDYQSEVAVLTSTLRLERLLSHDHDGTNECPTCLSTLDLDAIKHTVEIAKKKLPKVKKMAAAAKLVQDLEKLRVRLPEFDAEKFSTLKKRRKKYETIENECQQWLNIYEKYNGLVEQRNAIEMPDKPEGKRPKMSVDEIDANIDLCNNILEALASKDAILQNHPQLAGLRSEAHVRNTLANIEEEAEALDGELSNLRDKQSSAAEAVSQYEHYKNTNAVYADEKETLERKIAKLSPAVADKKILEVLMKAYGTKGLRATAAQSVCRLLQTNMNHYRSLVFAEPFTFAITASDTGVSIRVDRNNGKPDSISDVRHLSGAESNSFQLLCLISLLPLLPQKDRVNIVVLDEPTSHMDIVSRSIFNERFVPMLREVVPSIYIISPHQDDISPNSVEWVVKKQRGVSTLVTSN